MIYDIIQSGSQGNCTIVDRRIAIDIGVPYYKIEQYVPELRLVLLTHQHSDHFKPRTVRRLARMRPTVRWACGEWMVPHLIDAGVDKRNIDVMQMDSFFVYGSILDICISPFETRHDVRNCGWKLWRSMEDSLVYATDCADLDEVIARRYKIYLIEANYREDELQERIREKMEAGVFAYDTRTEHTHLSYEQAIRWLQENMGPDSIWIPMHTHREKGRDADAEQADQRDDPDVEESQQST